MSLQYLHKLILLLLFRKINIFSFLRNRILFSFRKISYYCFSKCHFLIITFFNTREVM